MNFFDTHSDISSKVLRQDQSGFLENRNVHSLTQPVPQSQTYDSRPPSETDALPELKGRSRTVTSYGLSFYLCEFCPGAGLTSRTPDHSLWLLCLGIEGNIELVIGEEVKLILPGQVELVPVNSKFSFSSVAQARGLWVGIPSVSMRMSLRRPSVRSNLAAIRLSILPEDHPGHPLRSCLQDIVRFIGTEENEQKFAQIVNNLLAVMGEAISVSLQKYDSGATPMSHYVSVTEQFIADHITHSLSIGDLAAASGVSPRTLHEGFRKTRGYSPMRFLRDQRLMAIRDELAQPEPDTSVTEAALKWGFSHLGRFSHYYTQRFGEKPSETLRLARKRTLESADVPDIPEGEISNN